MALNKVPKSDPPTWPTTSLYPALLSPLCSFCTVSDDFPALPSSKPSSLSLSRHDFLHSDHPSLSCGSISLPLRFSQMAPVLKTVCYSVRNGIPLHLLSLDSALVSSEHFSLLDILYYVGILILNDLSLPTENPGFKVFCIPHGHPNTQNSLALSSWPMKNYRMNEEVKSCSARRRPGKCTHN